jgi:hypothetical protein
MDNVQDYNSYINIPSPQAYRFHLKLCVNLIYVNACLTQPASHSAQSDVMRLLYKRLVGVSAHRTAK